MPEIDSGHTAWLLTASALVLLMTPGLALFYGGMTGATSVVNTMMMCLGGAAVVSVLWVLYGHSLAFGGDVAGLVGGVDMVGLRGLVGRADGGVPDLLFSAFQMMFAVVTVALVSGAAAGRARFTAWLVFAAAWVSVGYFPVAHWVWGGGWLGPDGLGVVDFAGGTAVHVNAGAAALALGLVLGPRAEGSHRHGAHHLPMVLLGAGLLWFGWFGFNAGSALVADTVAATAFLNTQVATAAAVGGWALVERLRGTRPTLLGACSGAVAGLVAVTPACAVVEPLGAIALGLVAGTLCALAVHLGRRLGHRLGYDDALDVVGVHLVGGAVGSLLTGVLAAPLVTGADGVRGLLYGGGAAQFGVQAAGVLAVAGYSFAVALVLGLVIERTIGFRVPAEDEAAGVDVTEHAERAYQPGAEAPESAAPAPVFIG